MIIFDFFNNLNPTNFLYQNELVISIFHITSVLLLNAIAYFYILVKFYKVLCYSKMTFEWLPMINPYVWPFSVFHILTRPYFDFWSNILPSVKFERSSVEISGIIALEALNSLIYFCVKLTTGLVTLLETLENVTAGT